MQGIRHALVVWDHHHGQASRTVIAGCPVLRGATMQDKQADMAQRFDDLRALVCREPRGHRNLLGAFVTEPVTPDGDAGLIFIHPGGYFDACGDSTFCAAVALLESGRIPRRSSDGEQWLRFDTVGGRVDVRAIVAGGQVRSVAMRSAPAEDLGEAWVDLPGTGRVRVRLGWAGLLYAVAAAGDLQVALQDAPEERDRILDAGTRLWRAAREQVQAPARASGSAGRAVDLVTLTDDRGSNGHGGPEGARVAHFYAPQTMGRTPSGTGTAARAAILHRAGRLPAGVPYYHESLLGLRFTARVLAGGGDGVVSEIETMSYLMGMATLFLRDDDPFPAGFAV